MNTPVLGPLLAFAAVLALIPAALWLLKRTPMGGAALRPGGLRLVAALPLAPNQRVVTVEVGEGADRRWLVLGVTPAGIHTLHTLPPQAEAPAAQPGAGGLAGSAFAQLLQRQRGVGARANGNGNGRSQDHGGGDAR